MNRPALSADGISLPVMTDLLGPEHLAGLYERFARKAVSAYNDRGVHPPAVIVITLDSEDPLQVLVAEQVSPDQVEEALRTPAGQLHFAQNVAALLDPDVSLLTPDQDPDDEGAQGRPVHLVVQVCEVLGHPGRRGASTAAVPQRSVMVALHTALGSFIGLNPVTESPEGRLCRFVALDLSAPVLVGATSLRPQHRAVLH